MYLKIRKAVIEPDTKDVEGFETFMNKYTEGLAIERAAVTNLK